MTSCKARVSWWTTPSSPCFASMCSMCCSICSSTGMASGKRSAARKAKSCLKFSRFSSWLACRRPLLTVCNNRIMPIAISKLRQGFLWWNCSNRNRRRLMRDRSSGMGRCKIVKMTRTSLKMIHQSHKRIWSKTKHLSKQVTVNNLWFANLIYYKFNLIILKSFIINNLMSTLRMTRVKYNKLPLKIQ